jgi:hypothetical protein
MYVIPKLMVFRKMSIKLCVVALQVRVGEVAEEELL